MMQLFAQMMRFPMAALVISMEMLTKAMQGMQKIADQGIDTMVSEISQTSGGALARKGDLTDDATDGAIEDGAETTHKTIDKEEKLMADLDLGGDDLKYVSYSVLFTKRDYEATLQEEKQEIVDYPTDGGSYGGLKIAQFSGGKHDIPREWKKPNYPSPSVVEAGTYSVDQIPTDDQKFITFVYRVDNRLPKSTDEYQRRQVEALEQIARKGDKIA